MVKKLPDNAGDVTLISGLGRAPAEGNPLQYSCLENPTDRGARWSPESGMTQQLHKSSRLGLDELPQGETLSGLLSYIILPIAVFPTCEITGGLEV